MVLAITIFIQLGFILGVTTVANHSLYRYHSGSFATKRIKNKIGHYGIIQTISFSSILKSLFQKNKKLVFQLDCLHLLKKIQEKNPNATYSMISHALTKRALTELQKANVISNLTIEENKKKRFLLENLLMGNFKDFVKSGKHKKATYRMSFQTGNISITNELILDLIGSNANQCNIKKDKNGTIKKINYSLFLNKKVKQKQSNKSPITASEKKETIHVESNTVTSDTTKEDKVISQEDSLKRLYELQKIFSQNRNSNLNDEKENSSHTLS